MPAVTSPTASHFHPYRQVPDSYSQWQTSLAHSEYSYAHADASYWFPESKPKIARARRYSVGCTQPTPAKYTSQGPDLEALHNALFNQTELQPIRSITGRARRASRSTIYDAPRHPPPTPWLCTVPLPHAEDDVMWSSYSHSSTSSHSGTSSIDSAGSWSPDASFLKKYAALPKCTDDSDKVKSQQEATGATLIPELAKESRLKWDVRNMPHGASFHALPGVAFARPELNVPALSSEIKNVSISFDCPRAEVFKKGWGCILVRARSSPLRDMDLNTSDASCRHYETITVLDLMDAIFKYFNERLSSEEIAKSTCSSTTDSTLLKRIGAARLVYTGHSKEGDRYRRVDLLDDFRFRSLKVDTMSGDWCHLHLRLK